MARGIEDMQIEYQDGTRRLDQRPDRWSTVADLNTVVREVRVTLSARALAPNLQGASTPGTGSAAPMAVRGQLVRVVAPRGSLTGLYITAAMR